MTHDDGALTWYGLGVLILWGFALWGLLNTCACTYDRTLGTYADDMHQIRKDYADLDQRVIKLEHPDDLTFDDNGNYQWDGVTYSPTLDKDDPNVPM